MSDFLVQISVLFLSSIVYKDNFIVNFGCMNVRDKMGCAFIFKFKSLFFPPSIFKRVRAFKINKF